MIAIKSSKEMDYVGTKILKEIRYSHYCANIFSYEY